MLKQHHGSPFLLLLASEHLSAATTCNEVHKKEESMVALPRHFFPKASSFFRTLPGYSHLHYCQNPVSVLQAATFFSRHFSSTATMATTDIEDLHHQAVLQGAKSYQDPATDFTVFTELFHLERGKCCGNQCRHCPYGWDNVGREDVRRPAKVKSGDTESVKLYLEDLKEKQEQYATANKNNNRSNGSTKKKIGGTYGGRLTDKNVPYTKKGDQGTSQLLTGERRSKHDVAFEAMGTVDELCSVVGVAHALLMERQNHESESNNITNFDLNEVLVRVTSCLFDDGSDIAKLAGRPTGTKTDEAKDIDVCSEDENNINGDHIEAVHEFKADGIGGGLDIQHVEDLEDCIDLMSDALPELRNFILPTGSITAAQFHVCRTVCRRAERSVVPLVDQGVCDPNVMKYLNRLSDFFFVAARWCNYCQKTPEIEYRRPDKRDKQRVAQARDNTERE